MAAIAQTAAKLPGFANLQKLVDRFCSTLDTHNVPHWVDYLNTK